MLQTTSGDKSRQNITVQLCQVGIYCKMAGIAFKPNELTSRVTVIQPVSELLNSSDLSTSYQHPKRADCIHIDQNLTTHGLSRWNEVSSVHL